MKKLEKSEKRTMGRPPLGPGEGKKSGMFLRISADELDKIRAASQSAGTTMSDWIRSTLLRAAQRVLRKP